MLDTPLRPTFWNIPLWAQIGIYALGLLAVAVLVWGVLQTVKRWRQTKTPLPPLQHHGDRLRYLWTQIGSQKKVRQNRVGKFHMLLSWGFFFLFLGTVLATIDWDVGHYLFGSQFLKGNVYLLYKTVLDLAGLLATVALIYSIARRLQTKNQCMPQEPRWMWGLTSLLGIIVSGFMLEGLRLAATHSPWAIYSPVGNLFAKLFLATGASSELLSQCHLGLWILHGLAALLFVAWIPYTIYAHLYKTSTQLYVRGKPSLGQLPNIEDMENQTQFGIGYIHQLTQAQRIAIDACTECGRCNHVCPSKKAGTPLMPRKVMQGLRAGMNANKPEGEDEVTQWVSRDAIWSCTNCSHCERVCPANIPIPSLIVQMRRHLAMDQGQFPEGMQTTLENVASVGNPWGLDPYDRLNWGQDLDLPIAEPGVHYDILYWVGCAASFDKRSQKIARAMVELLRRTGTNFAIMAEERCHGEFARRMGEEYLFQTALMENAQNLSQYSFDRLLAPCPHCLQTLKHDYPTIEGVKELIPQPVIHHTELIAQWIEEGKLPSLHQETSSITYHDPCFLARMNGLTEPARQILHATHQTVIEPTEHGLDTRCCGGGGGLMWTDVHGKREPMPVIRLKDLRATQAQSIASSCPHCLTMLNSTSLEAGPAIRDIAEVVLDRLHELDNKTVNTSSEAS